MKKFISISGKKTEISTPEKLPSPLIVRPGGWLVSRAPDGTQVKTQVLLKKQQLSFSAGGQLFHGSLQVQSSSKGSSDSGADNLIASFPGKVRKILVKAGQAVSENEPLLLVEAMKMEFSIKAPYTGVVEKLNVSEGEQLSPGTKYLDLKKA